MGLRSWFGFGQAIRAQAGLPGSVRPPNPPPSLPSTQASPETKPDPQIPDGQKPPQGHYADIPVANLGPWDVPRIQAALNAHQVGSFNQSALLAESMVGDDRVQTALNGRIKGVTARHLHTVPAKRDTKRTARRAVERVWRKVFTDELLDQFLMWATFLGFVLCEVQWTAENDDELGEVWVPYLKIWHPMFVWYDVSARQYVAITQEGNVYIEEDDPHWFLYTPWGRYRGWLRGAVRSCAPPWLIRQFSRRDWARYCEVHGLPIRLIDSPAQSSVVDKSRMFNQIRNMGAQTTILLPQQGMGGAAPDGGKWDIRLLEAKDESWAAFPGLIANCDMAIQLSIRGTNLTSEIQGGSYAAAQVHSDEDTAYGDADSRKLCAEASRLMRRFCAYNFGDAALAPFLRLEAPDKQDKTMLAQSQLNAMSVVQSAIEKKIPIDVAAYFERYDIPLIGVEEGEVIELDDSEPNDDGDGATDVKAELAKILHFPAAS
jgi:phage gp29-like protein